MLNIYYGDMKEAVYKIHRLILNMIMKIVGL